MIGWIAMGAATVAASGQARAPLEQRLSAPLAAPAPVAAIDSAVDDARRAAAARLLVASRFRDRQAVVLPDGIKAAESDLTSECIDRAANGRSLADCRAVSGAAVQGRLNARRSDMLDEVMAASQTIYSRRFTTSELDEITRFFRTPVGRKYSELYPQVIAEVGARRGTILRRYLGEASRSAPR